MQGADGKALRLDVTLSVDHGHVYGVGVLRGTGYSDVDSAVVRWIQANWKTAPWFGVGTENAVSFEIDPTLRQVRFEARGGRS
jgi:outer membrane biosynthesis protein TonB